MQFTYPVTLQSTKWKEFTTHQQMLDVCQIPSHILDEMTTEELIRAVLQYPLLIDIMLYDTPHGGIEATRGQFNGLEALLNREDVELCCKDFQEQKILDSNDQSSWLSDKVFESIITFLTVPREIKDVIDHVVHTVRTPNNTGIVAWRITTILTDVEVKTYNNHFQQAYPRAQFLSDSTWHYNCHSYAWFNQSSRVNRFWINDPVSYTNDKSYKSIQSSASSVNTKRIIYKKEHDITHSGLYDNSSELVTSKWGRGPLMKHEINYCPYPGAGISTEFYVNTQREGSVSITNNFNHHIYGLFLRHSRSNLRNKTEAIYISALKPNETIYNALSITYELGIASPFDYWFASINCNNLVYGIKDNFYCYIDSSDDGEVAITLDGSAKEMLVKFSSSSGCYVAIKKEG